jgi:hypothetical protein
MCNGRMGFGKFGFDSFDNHILKVGERTCGNSGLESRLDDSRYHVCEWGEKKMHIENVVRKATMKSKRRCREILSMNIK